MLMDKLVKEQKGIVISDAIIAILIIMLFTGIIVSLIVNIVLESQIIKLNSQQIDFATEILEYAELLTYEEVTEEKLIEYINKKNVDYVSAGTGTESLTTTYRIAIDVQKYSEIENNTEKLDIIKIVTVTVETDLDDKEYTTTVSGLKKATTEEVEAIL